MSETVSHQQEVLAVIGRKLRAAREQQGLSLQEVSARTRIQSGILEKIEQGQRQGLPSLAFVRGFIRNYMQTLNLQDPELLHNLVQLAVEEEQAPPPPMKASTERLLDAEKGQGLPWPRFAMVAVLAVLVVWAGYLLYHAFSGGETPAPSNGKTPAVQSAPAPAAPVAAPQAGAPAVDSGTAGAKTAAPAPAGATQDAAPAPSPAGGQSSGMAPVVPLGKANLHLTLRGLDNTWVRLKVDEKPPVEMHLRPAESMDVEGDQEMHLTLQRSDAVAVYLNGDQVPLPPGKNRLVPDLVLNKVMLLRLQN
ncbi:MAG TPA: helix-turn-helix transcriptional regulator [bacterium]|nr:helix-turn-helix transcriptional regulator [bacterium]